MVRKSAGWITHPQYTGPIRVVDTDRVNVYI